MYDSDEEKDVNCERGEGSKQIRMITIKLYVFLTFSLFRDEKHQKCSTPRRYHELEPPENFETISINFQNPDFLMIF